MIYLDLDGVCLDFDGYILSELGFNRNDPSIRQNVIRHGLYSVINKNKMWKKIAHLGKDFWANLPEANYFDKLWKHCHSLTNDVFFLSSPSYNPDSLYGKLVCLQNMFGDNRFDKYILTRRKELLANPSRLLIDDTEKQIDNFKFMGGKAVLWPGIFAIEDNEDLLNQKLEEITLEYTREARLRKNDV